MCEKATRKFVQVNRWMDARMDGGNNDGSEEELGGKN